MSPRALLGAHFLLFTGSPEMAIAAPGIFTALGLQAVVHKVGPDGLLDQVCAWATASGVGPTGTVLVRPDGVIAWRTPGPSGAGELDKALRTVLAR